jgi:hypothetical protein
MPSELSGKGAILPGFDFSMVSKKLQNLAFLTAYRAVPESLFLVPVEERPFRAASR